MVARPPAPALFPYTTLFRSLLDALHQRARQRGGGGSRAEPAVHVGSAVRAREAVQELARHSALLAAQERDAVDRKSTRLNSSHVEISYAVFCLKKKSR